MWIVQRGLNSRAIEDSKIYTIEKGQSVVNRLGQQVAYIEGVAQSIAGAARMLPKDPAAARADSAATGRRFRRFHIAGGGIWPEPYSYASQAARHSFFWGRDQSGRLAYFDDYNDPKGKGYHNEEWYVPAKYYRDENAYWSQSYMDPYSLEPMVTCSVPYSEDGILLGVVTVDVKLEGLHQMFAEEAPGIQGLHVCGRPQQPLELSGQIDCPQPHTGK